MVEIVTVVLEVVKCLASSTQRHLAYLLNYNDNIQKLNPELENLKVEIRTKEREVSEAERKGEKIEEKVEKWMLNANNIIGEAKKFISDETTTDRRCLKGLCPNLKTRYQLSKKAETKFKTLVECREEAGRLGKMSYLTYPDKIWLKSHKGYEAFESRLSAFECIQNALTDVNVSIVGVYGMGGIGKTTLVKEIARQALADELFDQVVFSEVSETVDIKNIQRDIAEDLGLALHGETESRTASRLYDRLKNEKRILVVLDNIWKYLDLETVGIPFGDDHRGCKLLLTARDLNVLRDMDSKDNFLIDNLNQDEGWRLFKKMAGDYVENRKFKSTATDVAKGCGGLPIALTTIARAMRDKSVHEWKNALRELQTPSVVNFKGLPADTYSNIELSFKYLKDEQLKKIFLLCSLMGNPIFTSDLFKYSIGLGIVQGDKKMEYARNQLYALAYKLRDSCLLLESGSYEQFSMHDVVRDVGISIACRDQHVFLVKNEDVWELPDKEALENCYAISIRGCHIHELPEGLECPQLEFLYISPKDSYLQINIPANFFAGMRKLRVVDFTGMQFLFLPSSIGLLLNLQTLCLDHCMLRDIAIIGKLKNLEILSMVNSDIVQLPEALCQLTKLRLLDLTNCFQLRVIAPNIISCLTRLEELYMRNCFVEWEVQGCAGLDELMHLTRLTSLEIDVRNGDMLPEGFFSRKFEKFEKFKISVGDVPGIPSEVSIEDWFRFSRPSFSIAIHETLRRLKLKLNSTTVCLNKSQGIRKVEYLCLDKLQGVKNVLFELNTEGFSELKHLKVQNNPDMLCIVDSMERVPCDFFPLLESLTLYNLINLERICIDPLKVKFLKELQTIKVEYCVELSNIFLLSATNCLPRLERIAVIDCSNVEEIFAVGGEADVDNNNAMEKMEFAELKSLSLGNLPKLTSFCRGVKPPSASPNRQDFNEISLDTSTPFFDKKVVLPNLEALELYQLNVEKIWHNQLPGFQSLTRLIVCRCHNLKHIFSASMIRIFEQLQLLEIHDGVSLLEIISEEGADQVNHSFVFRRLTTLRLLRLPQLRCLYPGMHTSEWPSLSTLQVCSCDKLKAFASELSSSRGNNDEKNLFRIPVQPLFLCEKVFPNLENVALSGKDIQMIFLGNFPRHIFGRLRRLEVWHDDLAAGFPVGLLEILHNLETLHLSCNSYKEIFSNEGCLEKHVGVSKLARIKILQLVELNHLINYLLKQDSQLDSIFQYLEFLSLNYCRNLLSLLPLSSSVSFGNLTHLVVFSCKKLMNLVPSSVAKSLMRLVTLRVSGCSAMTQVVVSCDQVDSDIAAANLKEEIVFSKLRYMALLDLENLTSFCSGIVDYTFKFPSLEDLIVTGCRNMKIFTSGDLITPKRVDVWYSESACLWDNDLNTTIQHLHQEKLLEGSSSYSTMY